MSAEEKIDISFESKNFYKGFIQQLNEGNEFLKEIKEIKNKDTSDFFYRYELAIKAAMAYHIIDDVYNSSSITMKNSLLDAKKLDEGELNDVIKAFCERHFELIHKFALEVFKEKISTMSTV